MQPPVELWNLLHYLRKTIASERLAMHSEGSAAHPAELLRLQRPAAPSLWNYGNPCASIGQNYYISHSGLKLFAHERMIT